MSKAQYVTVHDRLGNRLRARLLANGHIALSEHVHRYTYARVNRRGDIELYDDNGNFSYGSLENGVGEARVDAMADAEAEEVKEEPLRASSASEPHQIDDSIQYGASPASNAALPK